MANSFITKKIPRRAITTLRKLQQEAERGSGGWVPESRVIEKALEFSESRADEFIGLLKDKPYRLDDLIGIAPKTLAPLREEEHDIYLYGA